MPVHSTKNATTIETSAAIENINPIASACAMATSFRSSNPKLYETHQSEKITPTRRNRIMEQYFDQNPTDNIEIDETSATNENAEISNSECNFDSNSSVS